MPKLKLPLLIVFVALLTAAQPTRAGHEDIVVIANRAVKTNSISREDLRPIFQAKKNTWPDGSALRAFNLPESHPARQEFDAAVLRLDPERVARFWIDQKIRGGQRPPTSAPAPTLMVRMVAATPGAIGYVPSTAVNDSVKIVARISNGQVGRP